MPMRAKTWTTSPPCSTATWPTGASERTSPPRGSTSAARSSANAGASAPTAPCSRCADRGSRVGTSAWIGARGWLRTFDRAGLPGAYLAVLEPGHLRPGAPMTVLERPDHGVRVCDLYRAMTTEPDRWPQILAAVDDLSDEARDMGRAGRTYTLG